MPVDSLSLIFIGLLVELSSLVLVSCMTKLVSVLSSGAGKTVSIQVGNESVVYSSLLVVIE